MVAAVSVSGPSMRLTADRIVTVAGLTMRSAALLSAVLGFDPHAENNQSTQSTQSTRNTGTARHEEGAA